MGWVCSGGWVLGWGFFDVVFICCVIFFGGFGIIYMVGSCLLVL